MEIEIKGNLRIKINPKNNTASITKSPKASGQVSIPHFAEYENKNFKIISIEANAFTNCNIDSLTFAKDSEVETFDENCFLSAKIKKLEIPAKVKNLHGKMFDKSLTEITISPNNEHFTIYKKDFLLSKVNKSSEKFDVLIFALFDIEEAVIPPQIKVIKKDAFANHDKLKSVKFPPNSELKCIEDFAFGSSIESLSLPSSVELIGDDCFFWTPNLQKVEISEENDHFKLIDGKYIVKESVPGSSIFDAIIFARRDIKSIVIPRHIKAISNNAFQYCACLENVTFEDNSSLELIKKCAFQHVSGPEKLFLPPSLKETGGYSFSYIKNIKSIEFLGNSVKIGESCFISCSNLSTVTFPNADQISFGSRTMAHTPDNARILVRKSAKLSGTDLAHSKNQIGYIDDSSETVKRIVENVTAISDDDQLSSEEIEDLADIYLQTGGEISKLKEDNKKMKDIIKKMKEENAKLKQNFTKLKQDNAALKEDSKKMKDESNKIKDESNKIKEENTKIKDENNKIKDENTKIKDENSNLKTKVKELEEKLEAESSKLAKAKIKKLELFDPDRIDALKVEKTIGRGSQSEVFEVTREQRLALKVLFVEGINKNDKQLQLFLHEHEILSSLCHPNIVKTFGFCYGDARHAPSILLELCEQNLNDRIGDMDKIEKVCSIIEITEAMEAVHAASMIHRHLRPENILFDIEGHVKISDFGVASIVDVEGQRQSKSSDIGTSKFMAPELLKESAKCDGKVDVYSFGVVVFFILSGGKLPKITVAEQASGKKASIPSYINKVSRDLINSCWSASPSERPSFTDILDVIKKNNFRLIDGVEKNIIEITNFVNL